MGLKTVSPGNKVPDEVNVIIEIPMLSKPVKYEVDKDTGTLWVDRFMSTSMRYPCDYGYIPQTLSEDGDPLDVMVVTPYPLISGSVVSCRPIAFLEMTDESGVDSKLLAVPVKELTPIYENIHEPEDMEPRVLAQIKHFFEHYKDLEVGKWVKIGGWQGSAKAKQEILDSIKRYQ